MEHEARGVLRVWFFRLSPFPSLSLFSLPGPKVVAGFGLKSVRLDFAYIGGLIGVLH